MSHTPAATILHLARPVCEARTSPRASEDKSRLVVAGLSSGGSGCLLCPAAVGDGRSVREVRAGGSCCGSRVQDEVS